MAEELVSIKSINVKNYKSIIDLTIQLGTFNVLIGANGCGKSNILEAIALGAAASADKLDFEYFGNRGIRIVKSQMMLPAFEGVDANGVNLSLSDSKNNTHSFYIYFDQNAKPAKWKAVFNTESIDLEQIKKMMKENGISEKYTLKVVNNDDYYERFMILSAVESIIRRSDDSNKTYPLGLHGEGLFAYLKELSQRTNSESFFNELKENLTVFDWFDDIKIPKNQLSNEFNISLKDNYLDETLNVFDQNSTNEKRSIWVDFFGIKTACLPGIENYAKLFDLPVIFMEIRREKRGYYRCYVSMIAEDPSKCAKGEITQKYMSKLEEVMRNQPETWLWSHKRWKATLQPDGSVTPSGYYDGL